MKPHIQDFRTFIDTMKAVAAGACKPPRGGPRRVFASKRAAREFLENPGNRTPVTLTVDTVSAVSRLLTPENQALLKAIASGKAQSVAELAELTHRAEGNLSRTLKKFEALGLVALEPGEGRAKVPHLAVESFCFEIDLLTGKARAFGATMK